MPWRFYNLTAGQESRGPLCRRTQRTSVQLDEAHKMDEDLHRPSLQKRTKLKHKTVLLENSASPQYTAEIRMQRRDTEGLVRRDRSANVLGWGLSALLHGLVLVVAIPFMVKVTMPPPEPRKQPFRWEVSLITAPAEKLTADVPTSRAPAPPPDGAASLAQLEPQVEWQNKALDQADAVPATKMPTRQSAGSRPTIPAQNQPTLEPHTQSVSKVSPDPVPFAESMEAALPPPDVNTPPQTDRVQVHAETEHLTVVRRRLIERPVVTREFLPDYGWLADALRAKIERVKRYPHLAKLNRWQGRVVVQMKVREDGRLVNPEIEESSGYEVLDEAALATVQDASPVRLAHRLEHGHVVISLPINYKLD